MWCLNRLLSENSRCPNCREPYDRSRFKVVDDNEESNNVSFCYYVEENRPNPLPKQEAQITKNLVEALPIKDHENEQTMLLLSLLVTYSTIPSSL